MKKWGQRGGNDKKTRVEKLLVKTSDNKMVYISNKILKESPVIQDILEDISPKDDKTPVPLDRVSESQINIIDNNLDTSKFDLNDLKGLINAANYLQMEVYIDNIATQIATILQKRLK